jgi:hypothetical protein
VAVAEGIGRALVAETEAPGRRRNPVAAEAVGLSEGEGAGAGAFGRPVISQYKKAHLYSLNNIKYLFFLNIVFFL